jgi:Protocatechuate 3,4-dioxygenase beta subunit
LDDGISPSYKPNAPERTIVGQGHVLTGVVLSSLDCQPIAHAQLEFWPEEDDLGHPDASRATFFTDENGYYHFECNMPDHIHMRISAPGYRSIGVNSYHPNGQPEGMFDIVLVPE